MSDNKVLSQEEVDALLNASPAGPSDPGPASPASVTPTPPSAAGSTGSGFTLVPEIPGSPNVVKVVPVSAAAAAGPVIASPAGVQPSLQGGPASSSPPPQPDTSGGAAMAAANFTKDVDELRKRIEKLEKSLKKIEALEKRMDQAVEAIRKVASSVPKGVDKQVQLIWQGLQSTPDYNLYEKFVCKKCGGAGAAQIKSRCGHCGAEGWFGKREARPSPLTPPLSATPRSGARPSSKK